MAERRGNQTEQPPHDDERGGDRQPVRDHRERLRQDDTERCEQTETRGFLWPAGNMPTRPAGKFEPPRQRLRTGDEPPKVMLFLGRAKPASPAPAPRAPVGGAGPPASRALQAMRDSQLGHRAVLEISAAWRDKQAADQTCRDIEWLDLPPLADSPLVDWPLAPRHMVPVGDRHQAHLPKLGFDSAERSCVLVHSPGYVHSQPPGLRACSVLAAP